MSQSLAKLYIHLIFSTKNREPLIQPEIRLELNSYLAGTLRDIGCPVLTVNCVADHVHALFLLARTVSMSSVVEEAKKSSSKWIKTKGNAYSTFYWQAGYGAFSVSQSLVETTSSYIAKQEEHHRIVSFQDEYRDFLRRYQIDFDERYVWD